MNRLRKKCYLLCATFSWGLPAAFAKTSNGNGVKTYSAGENWGGQIIIIIIVILILSTLRYFNLIWSSLEGHTHKTRTPLWLLWQGQQVKCWHHSWLFVLCLTNIPFSSCSSMCFICQSKFSWLFPGTYYHSAPTLFLTQMGLLQVWGGPYLATKVLSDLKPSLTTTTWNILHKTI